jgi:hypothetical protein
MIYLLILLMSLSCKSEMHKASFQFKGIKKYEDKLLLTLSSKQNVFEMYEKEDAVALYLHCPLDGNFDNPGSEDEFTGYPGQVKYFEESSDSYFYEFEVYFLNSIGNNLSQHHIDSVLNKTICLECEMVLAHYFTHFSDQFSPPFCISTNSIKNAISK